MAFYDCVRTLNNIETNVTDKSLKHQLRTLKITKSIN